MMTLTRYTSQIEPKQVEDALRDVDLIQAMQEELQQLERNEVWSLVLRPTNCSTIDTE